MTPTGLIGMPLLPAEVSAWSPLKTMGDMLNILGIASAVSIGSNWVEVRNGTMRPAQAVFNGVAKGAAAPLLLKAASHRTPLQIAFTMGILAGAGFLIDSAMKKDTRERCVITEEAAG